MRCVFKDAILHTTVVTHGYLHYCHLLVSFDKSGPSPLTSLINNAFLPTKLLTGTSYVPYGQAAPTTAQWG